MEFGEVLFWRILLIRQFRQNKTLAKYTHYTVFQTRDAVDEKDFEVTNGADMVIEEEDRSDREGAYLGRI